VKTDNDGKICKVFKNAEEYALCGNILGLITHFNYLFQEEFLKRYLQKKLVLNPKQVNKTNIKVLKSIKVMELGKFFL